MTLDGLLDDLDRRIAESCLGPALKRRHSLASHTTYRVGGPARLYVTAAGLAELETLAVIVAETSRRGSEVPVLVIGKGSNLLVADRGFDGLAVALGPHFEHFEIDRTTVTASAAALLPVIARATVESGLSGFEWAVGVPGSVGGAVRMNAGGHGSDMSRSLVEALVVDLRSGATGVRSASELQLGYRSSAIAEHQVAVSVKLQLRFGDRRAARAELAEIVRWRRANQPGGRNAGSVFTNPEHVSAGALIESAGAKRLRVGTAEVSAKHANFIQCDEGGRAGDVAAVMREVQRLVKEAHGVELSPETRLVGFEPEELPRTLT
ncbi:MAG: UDP-N-acetylmuramate dehydrogenase [Acidimicrobiaceae bacterium]|nr:UDP-N-acetylmuramate dehydrogenase [Acidimicrobiaceae bacterium]MCY4279963.1 UDP-N-acetylmuramate dehydrogenase [Acidimicrobiaceae bacterium]MCY4294571.1 UDP-N-acetylmuramate dehydrogenase [Acidimicrobiaceae bacterium]